MSDKVPGGFIEVNTTSRAKSAWEKSLSPFFLGPVSVYDKFEAKNFENLWQFSKVYPTHLDRNNEPTDQYWEWAKAGWALSRSERYPMGRGAKPAYTLWDGQKLDYISARKQVYLPNYAELVIKTEGFERLKRILESNNIALRDFDGYDHVKFNMTLTEVLNNPSRKMGHAFIIAMFLTEDEVLNVL
jgi:hypothetical protein